MFEKWFCKHKWKTHAKEKYEWSEVEIVKHTEWWMEPMQQTIPYSEVKEVLICESCGKVHLIEY